MKKINLLLIPIFISIFLMLIPTQAKAYSPSAFGWTLGERIYGYPQWPKYYRWRLIDLGKWPVAHRYNAFMSVGPYQFYEIQVTPFGRVGHISGRSEFGSAKACKTAQLALSPGIASLAMTNKFGYTTGAYSIISGCSPMGTLVYEVFSNI